MLRRILVPTDGSEFGAQVLPIVRALATAHGAEVIFARVVDSSPGMYLLGDEALPPELSVETVEALESEAREELARLAGQFETDSLPVRTALLHGIVASTLVNYEFEVQPDLVVMATHSRAGLARLAFGSVADRMVLEGTAPVLLFGPSASLPATLERALVPLDGSPLAEEALLVVETLAGRPLRAVRLLRAVPSEGEREAAAAYLRRVAEALSTGGLDVEIDVRVDAPVHAIEAAAPDADVVIMATHGRGGLDRLRHGSVAQEAARLVVRPMILTRPTLRRVTGGVAQFLARTHPLNRTVRLAGAALKGWEVSLPDADGFAGATYRGLGWPLFTRPGLLLQTAIALAGLPVFVAQSTVGGYDVARIGDSGLVTAVFGLATYLVVTFVHEMAHALTVKHFGRRVHRAGFVLYLGMPAFFVDTTDIWLAPRWARVSSAFAGVFSGFVLGGLCSLALLWIQPEPIAAGLLYQAAFLGYVVSALNLMPLLELDGYYILVDLLEMPRLRERSFAFFRTRQWHRRWNGEERILGAYGILATLATALALAFAFLTWRNWLVSLAAAVAGPG